MKTVFRTHSFFRMFALRALRPCAIKAGRSAIQSASVRFHHGCGGGCGCGCGHDDHGTFYPIVWFMSRGLLPLSSLNCSVVANAAAVAAAAVGVAEDVERTVPHC